MASGLRIVFFGTPEFAATILRDLVDRGEIVVAAVTTPDKPQGRGRKLAPSAVRVEAERLAIPVLTPLKHRDPDFVAELRSFGADVFVVVAYKILPPEVFEMPRLGTFNLHASLLPKYRGAAPINWAIINGETETGLTTFLLDRNIDTGKILLQDRMNIGPTETAGELHDRMMLRGADLAQRTLELLSSGKAAPTPQSDTEATPAPKIFPDDCRIELTHSSTKLLNFIRGLSPYPGAYIVLPQDTRLKVLRAKAVERTDLAAGEFHVSGDRRQLFVGCGVSEALELIELQLPGKRAMIAEELLRGNHDLFVNLHAV